MRRGPVLSLPEPWALLEVEFRATVPREVFLGRVAFLETYDGWKARTAWRERRDWLLRDGRRHSSRVRLDERGAPAVASEVVRKQTRRCTRVSVRCGGARASAAISGRVVTSTEHPQACAADTAIGPGEVLLWRHKQTRVFRTERWTFACSRVWESREGYSDLIRARAGGAPPSSYELEIEANADSDLFSRGRDYVERSLELKIEDLFSDMGVVELRYDQKNMVRHK